MRDYQLSPLYQHHSAHSTLSIFLVNMSSGSVTRCYTILQHHTDSGGRLLHPATWHQLWELAQGWEGEPPEQCLRACTFHHSLVQAHSHGITGVIEDDRQRVYLVKGKWTRPA